jgi:hypothetical protein
MTRPGKIWLSVATVFMIVNVAGAGYAAAMSEGPHAGIHVVLGALGLWWMWRVVSRQLPAHDAASLPETERVEQLQQSVDAIAVEIERIGEAQRFTAKLEQERAGSRGERT